MPFIRNFSYFLLIGLLVPFALTTPADALAAKKSAKSAAYNASSVSGVKTLSAGKKARKKGISKAAARKIEAERFSALVVDADSGQVLYEKNAAGIRYPASLTKMMTLYLTFEALKSGKLHLGDTMPVSSKAAAQPQTNIALESGDRLPVKAAIESLVVRSANDSAMVVAEELGGTEWNFALLMTQKARQLGMKNTIFKNPNGLPDNQQHTTAYDMARLAIALRRDFPDYYSYFSLLSFEYKGVEYPTHNRVMERYPGADGVKTGYIRASGFNLVTSVKKNGYNIVAVIMGGKSGSSRDNQMMAMLDRTFAGLESQKNRMAKISSNSGSEGEEVTLDDEDGKPIVVSSANN